MKNVHLHTCVWDRVGPGSSAGGGVGPPSRGDGAVGKVDCQAGEETEQSMPLHPEEQTHVFWCEHFCKQRERYRLSTRFYNTFYAKGLRFHD
jgi:hypothetical protein